MYRDLSQYLSERIAAIGDTPSSLAERFGWGQTYLHNIINGQFRPSRRRCIQLAEAFGDDPNIILALAQFYVKPEQEHVAHLEMLNSLSLESQELALDYLQYLKWREDRNDV